MKDEAKRGGAPSAEACWYKRKRVLIPVALLALLVIVKANAEDSARRVEGPVRAPVATATESAP